MANTVWLKVARTGAIWEVPEEKAQELICWYKDEYAIVPAPVAADAPTQTPEPEKAPSPTQETPAGTMPEESPAADTPRRSRKEK